MEYCFTLSPAEVPDTLFAYLGDKPAVKAFADEFVKRTRGNGGGNGGGGGGSSGGGAGERDKSSGADWTETKAAPAKSKGKKR